MINNENIYFNLNIEFEKQKLYDTLNSIILKKQKGYICSINSNILSTASKDPNYLQIINNSSFNFCDGAWVAIILSLIHFRKFKPVVGLDLFIELISAKKYISLFLGTNEEILNGLKNNLLKLDSRIKDMKFIPLPYYDSVDNFDFKHIASLINQENPNIIWVSLGAPKQERFISKLYPEINQGVLFASGAAFTIFSGDKKYKRAPKIFRKLKLEGFYRAFIMEPKRLFPRLINEIKSLPKLILNEVKRTYF